LTTPHSYERATLTNGVRLLTTYVPHVRSAVIDLLFAAGSRYDPPAYSGIAHFLEHMIFQGSAAYPTVQVISETIEGVGGIHNASTGKESTAYWAKVPSSHFELAIDLLADTVRRPLLDPALLDKERRIITEELSGYYDSPPEWVNVLANELLWTQQPLGREVAGTRETLQAISREAMAAFHAQHYLPNNLIVSIVGNISHERALDSVTRLLGDWEVAAAPHWTSSPPATGGPRVRLDRRDTEQTSLSLIMPALPHRDPRTYTLALLSATLGDGSSSRLSLHIREQQGLAYDVDCGTAQYHDTGAFGVTAGVDPTRAIPALQAILGELARMRDEPVPAAELRRAREYTKGRMSLSLEDTGSVAGWLGGHEFVLGEVPELDEVLAKLDAVTAEDIQQLAREIFVGEAMRLALIGPHADASEFEAALRLP
jgi:predicted Zn-dependent peptidase